MTMIRRCDLVVPVHNGTCWPDKMMASLVRHPDENIHTVVWAIDAGSHENVMTVLSKYAPVNDAMPVVRLNNVPPLSIRYKRVGDDVGVTLPWNMGLRWAYESGADAICVINTDVVLGMRTLAHCTAAVLDHGHYLAYPQSIRGGDLPRDFDSRAAAAAAYGPGPQNIVCTGGFAGWCFVMSRECVEKVGYFDEQFTLWYQDTDYHTRLALAQNRAVEVRSCLVHHYESRTILTLKDQFQHRGWIARDAGRFAMKYPGTVR